MMPLTPMDDKAELLRMENVSIVFSSPDEADIEAVRQVDFTLTRGKTLALVGESGSGKSVTSTAILRLLPELAEIQGAIRLRGEDLLSASTRRMRELRGNRIAAQGASRRINEIHQRGKSTSNDHSDYAAPARIGRQARMSSIPPRIFSDSRRNVIRSRMLHLQATTTDAARFIIDDMVNDMAERLAFVRHEPAKPLIVGDFSGRLSKEVLAQARVVHSADIVGAQTIDLARPFPFSGFDFIGVLGLLDTVNDLPGALIHLRQALAPGGMVIAMFPGAGSLPMLRQAIYAAEPDRPAARMHPLVDTRAAAELLQRAGWKDPVVDSHDLRVRYRSLDRLVGDLREQGLGNALASDAPPITRAGMERARTAFMELAEEDGRVTEIFSILTLSGRRSLAGT